MSTDLVSWLRSQLDTDEQRHSVIMFSGIDDRRFELRTVAAHRAILDDYAAIKDAAEDPADEATSATYAVCLRVLDLPIRRLASIYEDRPGFDPSWRADT